MRSHDGQTYPWGNAAPDSNLLWYQRGQINLIRIDRFRRQINKSSNERRYHIPRKPRVKLIGVPQHVIQRGNNRQACFFTDQDYTVYLAKLHEYGILHEVNIHSYVLMTNHVHLLMTPETKTGISKLMQSAGRHYVRYIDQTRHRPGTLWEGRFKSTLVDSERYFLVISRYIELNPVQAAMVDHPASCP